MAMIVKLIKVVVTIVVRTLAVVIFVVVMGAVVPGMMLVTTYGVPSMWYMFFHYNIIQCINCSHSLPTYTGKLLKILFPPVMVAHDFNFITWEAGTLRSL